MESTAQQPSVTMISGPVVQARPAHKFSMNEMVEIGDERLVGEVIDLDEDLATIQVYEDTTGLRPGADVYAKELPLYVELGPGLMCEIFDGVQRPLEVLRGKRGDFIHRGKTGTALPRDRVWQFTPSVRPGATISPGEILGEVPESQLITHRIPVPPDVQGTLEHIVPKGDYILDDVIAVIRSSSDKIHELKLFHRWPVRKIRPYRERLVPSEPLITGQRVIDTFFPLARGGTAGIPGGFGTGKTVAQHQLSKWADADIIVYIGCGERGNEMTGVLVDLPKLLDPRTRRPLIERTILIANTSDMPVAAREASIYTGITIAEYYRDMGYDVALMADSTSRWAEALREISGRLEEMPAEEGFPAYLASRLAAFYERAGQVVSLAGKRGSVTLIGAVSPPGGDFSEPVTMHTKRFVQCFWALDKELASARYFPAINYLQSYSAYISAVEPWWTEKVGSTWKILREKTINILQEDSRLQNIVKLLGEEALPDDQKRIVEGARLLKNDFLQQSAFDPVDTYAGPEKQFLLLDVILHFIERLADVVKARIPLFRATELPVVAEIHKLKFTRRGDDPGPFKSVREQIDKEINALLHRQDSL
ncbi:MAG: V-type ATP synthase subunit A [Deltaproteobacteria bacterium]|uniref:V-type ATP synthase subunit A n=1 Tax=Candidatus Methanogaster sp. TaxID=3386292 RepID=A0AC61L126_9EURY|nr:MAG: V-type ATP synthase subunit A [ANME-2 cluster archaeon]PXF60289.1 MAG: V-type ATP synthase subunit A [Deltaproteobacteria bacterium]